MNKIFDTYLVEFKDLGMPIINTFDSDSVLIMFINKIFNGSLVQYIVYNSVFKMYC